MALVLAQLGGFGTLTKQLRIIDPTLLDITGGYTTGSLIAFIFGYTLMGAGFGLSQPHVTVRVMAGRNPQEVRRARWIYLAFIYGTWSATTLFGICCRLLLPEIADAEQSLPAYAVAHFSPWVVGLVLAGMFSTIASSADSQILACSSALARDVSPRMNKAMTACFGIRYQQAATVLTGIIAALATIYVSSSVFDLVIFSISVLSASVGAGMLILILRRPTSAQALTGSILAGVIVALTWRYLGYHDFISDVAPGMFAALLVHEILIYILNGEEASV